MILRDSQQEFVDKSVVALEKYGNTLGVASTGFGKTIVMSSIIGKLISNNRGLKTCVLAHRDELTYQNQDKFLKVNPEITTSLVNAKSKDWSGQVNFAMVQTLSRSNNLFTMPKIDFLVIDEAHHAPAKTYQQVIKRAKELNPCLKLLGVTATPARGDKTGLGTVFNNCAIQVRLIKIIQDGHLVMPRTFVIDLGVHEQLQALTPKTNGEYDEEEVADIMDKDPINEAVVEHWIEKAGDRKTVVFCSTIEHARNVTNAFSNAGVSAALITGELSKEQRAHILKAMVNGDIQVIVNVHVLTEGWDFPPISCVVLLRTASNKSTMIQMVGRGLRIVDNREYPDLVKINCIVLDFGASSLIHGNLEQDVDLSKVDNLPNSVNGAEEEEYIDCPECNLQIPKTIQECPFCGAVIREVMGKTLIANFGMREIDMLSKSKFAWGNIPMQSKDILYTCGFEAWSCVCPNEEHDIVVGGGNTKDSTLEPQVIYQGDKPTAISKGNDYLYELESESSAQKSAKWRKCPPSENQINIINKYLSKYSLSNLTQGDVSNIISFEFSAKNKIKQLGYQL